MDIKEVIYVLNEYFDGKPSEGARGGERLQIYKGRKGFELYESRGAKSQALLLERSDLSNLTKGIIKK